MKLRVARHTNNLAPLIEFYEHLLGLEHLGSFKDHDGYDGVFIGNQHWHLEFTVSSEGPLHNMDEDDLLVFYCDSEEEYKNLVSKLTQEGVKQVNAKNPYWTKNGTTFLDPDGFRVVLSV
jgi:uncharacterized glyoxalase superfamily protein PhnB